jgi:ribosomal protein L34
MAQQTLKSKGRISIIKTSGFRARMKTVQGSKIVNNRRRKNRSKLSLLLI